MSKEEKDKIVLKARLWLILHGFKLHNHSRCGLCKPFLNFSFTNTYGERFDCDKVKVLTEDLKTSSDVGVCVAWVRYL